MIESMANTKVKYIQKLMKQNRARKKEHCFVVEGWKMVSEALARNLVLHLYVKQSEEMVVSEHLSKNGYREEKMNVPVDVVSDAVFLQLSDTVTPQGIMAVVRMPDYEREDVLAGKAGGIYEEAKLLVLENIQDPGNIGTILRTAEGAGMSGVLLSKGCVDIFNPKVVRSTMGALFRVPFLFCEDVAVELQEMKQEGFVLYAAHLQGDKEYSEALYRGKLGILIGNEANGLSGELSALADVRVKIPMEGELESLNAAVSASLLSYEVHRQMKTGRK